MPHPIEPSTIRILNAKGQTIGTGFLVAPNLAVTCAHVALSASMDGENRIRVQFTGKKQPISARVLDDCFDIDRDVVILQVDEVPAGVFPLRMGRAGESKLKNDLYTFGYATAADEQGIGGLGTFITLKQEGNFIQFRMHEANHGHSGAPIYDDKRGVVVGMIKKGHTHLGRNAETTFAIPTETIWQVCPQLKPPTPVLPRRNPIVEGINLLPYDYDQRIQNFLGEYLGSDQHPVPFGGRDDALKMLDNWLANTTPYLLLAAPAGRGKSALLVRWLDSLKSRDDLALTFVPVSIRFGTNMERVFYAALAARLAFLHGDDVPASPETSTAVYRGLVNDYLSKPLANGRTLLVVLDGLDEAADWQAGADFMPSELPAGVRAVVSARFLAGDADHTSWLRRLNWERNGLASTPSIVPLDLAGVGDVLLKMGCPLDELSRDVDIVAELYRLSEGDPLLVSLYVGDLWAKGAEITRLKPEDLAGIQPGYKGYFDRWWEDQKKLWGKDKPWLEKHVRAVRKLLAGALGSLLKNDFQVLDSELESDYITDALDVLQRFVIGDNRTQGYTFSHPKLGQYFWEALTLTDQAQVERRFLAWGEQTLQEFIEGKRDPKKKGEVPPYVVRNYGAHLARTKQNIEKWLPLIDHQQWAQAWFTVEGAYGGYSQDVQRVWEQCKILNQQATESTNQAPHLGAQIRCALIETSLHSLAGKIPPELVWPLVRDGLWTLPQTWVFIHQMPKSKQQSDTINSLLPHLDDKQLPEALAAAQAIQNVYDRARVLSELAQHLPEVTGEALAAAQAIQNQRDRARVLSVLAQLLPEVTGEALAVARAIEYEEARADALSTLAQRLPERELMQLLADARGIGNVRARARVLSSLAHRLPKEELGQVVVAARAILDEWARADILSTLAQRLPELTREALAVTRAIKDYKDSRARILGILAQRLPKVAEEALAAAQAIQNEMDRANTLSELAQYLPEGELGQVLTAARTIENLWARARILGILAQRLPKVAEEALAAARAIQDEEARSHMLSILVQHLPEVAEEALATVQAIQYEGIRASALIKLAQYLPERKLGQVLAVAQTILDEGTRGDVLSELAQYLPERELGHVLVMARIIRWRWMRARILGILAQRLPEVTGEALAAAQAIRDEGDHENTLSELAWYLPEGELEQVLAAAWTMRREWARSRVLSALVQRLPEGELGKVLANARTMRNVKDRANVLSSLVQRLPKVAGEALAAAQAIRDEGNRGDVLSELAHYLPEEELGHVLAATRMILNEKARARILGILVQRLPKVAGEALAAAQAIRDEGNRGDVLSELAQCLPEGELGQVLEMARAIQDEKSRAHVLSALAQRLPGLEGEVLEAARAIRNEGVRANVLSELAQRLPEVAGEALEAVWAIQAENDRASVLSALTQPMMKMPRKKSFLLVEASLVEFSRRTRANLYSDLAALMPVIIHIGTDDTPHEIYQAVRDVTTWWP